jgi:hypothetical protein
MISIDWKPRAISTTHNLDDGNAGDQDQQGHPLLDGQLALEHQHREHGGGEDLELVGHLIGRSRGD